MPVEMIATLGFSEHRNAGDAHAGKGRHVLRPENMPFAMTTSPFRMSSPTVLTFSSGATAFMTSMLLSSTCWVCSNITTASAPFGSAPPVAIFMHSPLPMVLSGMTPHGDVADDG